MKTPKLIDQCTTAREELLRALTSCVRHEGNVIGAGQFILEDGTSEHIGIYGTAAMLETMSLCHPIWLDKNFEGVIRVIRRLEDQDSDPHSTRDSSLTFKLCAAINALRVVPSKHVDNTVVELRQKLVDRLVSLASTDIVLEMVFWPYARDEIEAHSNIYLLPTAYAVHTLNHAGILHECISRAIKFLVHHLRNHLTNQRQLHSYELVHILLALASVSESERNKYIDKAEIRRAEYFLYQFVLQNKYFEATYINYTITAPNFGDFDSLFYVIKTNLTIMKYFLQMESIYLKTSDIQNHIAQLIKSILEHKKFVDSANHRSAVRENALALRVLHLLTEKIGERRNLDSSALLTVYFKFIQWSPKGRRLRTVSRVLTLLTLFSIPIGSLHYSDDPWTTIVAICSGILATWIYEQLRRDW